MDELGKNVGIDIRTTLRLCQQVVDIVCVPLPVQQLLDFQTAVDDGFER